MKRYNVNCVESNGCRTLDFVINGTTRPTVAGGFAILEDQYVCTVSRAVRRREQPCR